MCDLFNERIRIDKILHEAIRAGGDKDFTKLDELTERCFAALQSAYHGACLDECLEAAARDFALRRLAENDGAERAPPPRLSDAA